MRDPTFWAALSGPDAQSGEASPLPTPDPDSRDAILSVEGLSKRFGKSEVLHSVHFQIHRGERVCLVGPSGSGKTTFLRCLNLLVEPTAGRLYFHGQLIGDWDGQASRTFAPTTDYRRHIGMVFQHFELFPHLTAVGNIALGPRHALGQDQASAETRARELLRQVGLERFADVRPASLSGGQKQRVAIARALAMQPDLILFDEPTSALDAEMVDEVLNLMRHLADEGMTMIIVTHELGFARDVADRVIVMEAGEIIEEGPAREMFEAPRKQRTREILRSRTR